MSSSARLWLLVAIRLLTSCGDAADEEHALPTLAPGAASCEAWADHQLEQCPVEQAGRLFNIARCEEDRVQHEPLGCGETFARWVLCATQATYDCEEGWPIGCEEEFDAMRYCPSFFAQRTLCSRVPRDRDCEGQAQPYSYACIGSGAPGCVAMQQTDAEQALNVGMQCCPSFAAEAQSYFSDPVLGPDELPPDHSAIDFADHTMCMTFSEGEGWGSCEESAGCACTHCAGEIEVCANEYSCLFSRRCGTSRGCDPNSDPFFTGYGPGGQYADELEACMETAECLRSCP
jgi:hypothetical protein